MSRRLSIGWFRQRSGKYALKGITITEGDLSYDAASSFREEDAKWLTWILGARANIEISSSNGGSGMRSQEDYPEWARDNGLEPNVEGVTPLDRERVGAAILRYYVSQLVEACDTENSAARQKLVSDASAALLATEAGTHYSVEQARNILERLDQKAGGRKVKK
ncbi:MAG TPA: hypothetical protein VGE04_02905 [Chloroflexia bacterium]|jgi:hypothetical protein